MVLSVCGGSIPRHESLRLHYQIPVALVILALKSFSADVEWCDGLRWMELPQFQSILRGHLPPLENTFPGRVLHDQYAALPKGNLAIPKGVTVLEQVTFDGVDMAGRPVLFSPCPYQYQATSKQCFSFLLFQGVPHEAIVVLWICLVLE